MSDTKHTPTLEFDRENIGSYGVPSFGIICDDPEIGISIRLRRYDPVKGCDVSCEEKAEEVALKLVKIWNTHPALLEALEGLMEWNGVYDAAVAHARFQSLAEHFMERGDAARKALATARA